MTIRVDSSKNPVAFSRTRRLYLWSVLLILVLILIACGRGVDEHGYTIVDTEEDPTLLPYSFIQVEDTGPQQIFPIALTGSERSNIYAITENWRPPDVSTAIVFMRAIAFGGDVLSHLNVPASALWWHMPHDFDGDGIEELAVTYSTGDSVWLEILDAFDRSLGRRLLDVGPDRDGNGYWDGYARVFDAADISGDGYAEALIMVYAGYDIEPRSLDCVDWFNDTLLWRFDVAGHISKVCTLTRADRGGEVLTALTIASVCNGAEAGAMDDSHSYSACLDRNGQPLWVHTEGGKFTQIVVIPVDYDGDGLNEVLVARERKEDDGFNYGELVAYDISGRTLDSVRFDTRIRQLALIDTDGDDQLEVMATLHDKTIRIFTQSLQPRQTYLYTRIVTDVYGNVDMTGSGQPQILVSCADAGLRLFSGDFEPLAALDQTVKPVLIKSADGLTRVADNNPDGGRQFSIERNSLLKAYFVKYKTHIIVVLGALLGGLLVSLLYQVRTRAHMRQITRQKDELQSTHQELRDMQTRLVEAEKYKQARDIAGGFAHEIRNALFPARTWLTKLRQRAAAEPQESSMRQETSKVEKAIDRAVKMTELITEYSKLEGRTKRGPADISRVIEEVIEANQDRVSEQQIEIKMPDTDEIMVNVGHHHLYILLNNLLLNSLDALTNVDRHGIIDIEYAPNGDCLELRFSDNGSGIPAAVLERVFDMFFSTRPPTGTGVGLAMVKRIVEMNGGSISLSSDEGKGTEVVLLLQRSGRRTDSRA